METQDDTDSASDSKTEQTSDFQLTPPDGKFGWVIVASSFVAHIIADGCGFSFGVLFTVLLEDFKDSRSMTAWIGSLFVSMPQICGPIASSLTNKYGCRRTTIAGGIIAAIGCFVSSYANSIGMLCFTFGIVAGFGLALVFVPAIVIVAFYFEQKRAYATGIAVAGSGIGTFIFAPLTDYLIKQYTWRGAFQITAGIMLNLIVCGALFRPLVILRRKSRAPSRTASSFGSRVTPTLSAADTSGRFELQGYLLNGDCVYSESITHSVILFPTYLKKEFDSVSNELLADMVKNGKSLHQALENRSLLDKFRAGDHDSKDKVVAKKKVSIANSAAHPEVQRSNALPEPSTHRLVDEERMKVVCIEDRQNPRWMEMQLVERFRMTRRNDMLFRGSLLKAGFMVNQERSASCPDLYYHGRKKERLGKRFHCTCQSIKQLFHDLFDFSIFKSVIFNYFCFHCLLLFLMYDIPYIYLPDQAAVYRIPTSDASFLVSIIGISSTVGQILIGYIGDKPTVKTIYFYNGTTSVAGLVTLTVPVLTTYWMLATYSCIYGVFISANFALTTTILVDLLGMEKLTNAYGFVSLAQGLANLIGPPIAGWICDVTGTYDLSFYLSGVVILVSGVMLFAVPCLERCHCCYVKKSGSGVESRAIASEVNASEEVD